ncbi:DUF1822 family protein [Laspinema olomoucense]|uniref:DUF1822 family protein n=1 Tax=Laspinema olomoucense TaxID=3231600 RepID=UPI0021BAC6EA|nr:DUF1822 family protein [Laspinema sp. D3a]MCT7991022.1 DUF1822 family protein [Laspinema sp. D3a]
METNIKQLTFTTSLIQKYHQMAQQFGQQHLTVAKSAQVYQNTLAVLAVDYYCQCLGIPTQLTSSDSWNPVIQSLLDIADLQLANGKKIECLPVQVDADFVEVSPEVLSERIGYIAVEINSSQTQARLLGFAETISTNPCPLSQFKGLECFIDCLHYMPSTQRIHLSQWLHHCWDAGWKRMEELLKVPQLEFALQFRTTQTVVKGGKLLDLNSTGDSVALLVGIKPTNPPEMDIWVEVYPIGEQTHLPRDLQVMVLDSSQVSVMQAQARSTKNIQLNFTGEPGDQFSIKLELGDVSVTEGFII